MQLKSLGIGIFRVVQPIRRASTLAGRQDDCHFDIVREETPSDDDSLTELRMVRVVDLGFRRLFAGSMPCDRARVGLL